MVSGYVVSTYLLTVRVIRMRDLGEREGNVKVIRMVMWPRK